ncbi:hypothetical protein N7519_008071 [Penicillium mononematosum]|uniref:uncharacterized protein n=1 Tax=Penicillium mononematosum TaxID=268346 RepID=UPI0025469FCA|nr:uncharacterized protein N7519_008071 [Penicillium mononematosum]KAJ6186770.1 hypothetical protein N7519_008071 [Penicillium mononematosum]
MASGMDNLHGMTLLALSTPPLSLRQMSIRWTKQFRLSLGIDDLSGVVTVALPTPTLSLPPNVYATDERVPTGNTSMSLVQKRLDALTEQLENHELRLDDLETESLPSRDDTFKVPNKRSNHSGLLTQAQNRVAQGANILADIKVIADSRDDRKKIRRWKGIFRDHYSLPWDECQVQYGLARVEAGMLDIFNIRANVRTLAKWRMHKNRPRCRQIQKICDYWIDLWRHDPLISVPSEASRQLWALYNS